MTVTRAGGTSATSAADQFSYGPAVTGSVPVRGRRAGGTQVIIIGSKLTGATAVNFGSTAATSFTVDSDTEITATSPAGTGLVDMTVTTAGGTSATSSADQFSYAPAVTAISPAYGAPRGGTQVTITGTTSPLTAVNFGSTAATTFTVVSDTQITATSRRGAAGT